MAIYIFNTSWKYWIKIIQFIIYIYKYFHLKLDINNQWKKKKKEKKKLKLNLTDLLKGSNSSHHKARKQCFRKISWIRYSNRATTNNRSKSRNDRLHNDPIRRGKWICAEVWDYTCVYVDVYMYLQREDRH